MEAAGSKQRRESQDTAGVRRVGCKQLILIEASSPEPRAWYIDHPRCVSM
jgi:hypothetical protein